MNNYNTRLRTRNRRAMAKENNMGGVVFFGAVLGILVGAAVVYLNLGII
jgi:H+/Cl- antiporter ClcA